VGAVYDRFTDKDGLIHAIQREVLDELDASLLAAFTELASTRSCRPASCSTVPCSPSSGRSTGTAR